ncbi:MAG: ABC transporter ATP-binding protein, partial [bacterium]|nr:ABC transporter ATP-binding protein [bacterium]
MSKLKSPNAIDWSLLKRLLPFAKPYKWGFAMGVFCMLTGTALELVGPLLTRKAIDEAIPNRDFAQLKWLVIGYFVFTSIGYLLRYAEGQISGGYGQRIVWDIRKKVFTHFQNHSLAFFDRNPVGKLMTRVTSDVAAMAELFHAGLVGLAGDILLLVGILIVLFFVDWRLALVTLTIGPVLIASSLVFRKHVRESMRRMRTEITNTNTYLQESVTGSKVVKLFRREKVNAKQFSVISTDLKKAQLQTIFFFAVFFPIVDILATAAIAGTLLTGGYRILYGGLSIGSLVAFLQYGERFFRPIRDLTEKFNTLLSAITGAERVFGVLDEPLDIVSPANPQPVTRLSGAIEFERVSFAYV